VVDEGKGMRRERDEEGSALLTGKGAYCLLDILSVEQLCHRHPATV
jgi:hypothetical protein